MQNFHLDDLQGTHRYDMIIGRGLFLELNIGLCFCNNTILVDECTYKGCTSSMKETLEIILNFSSGWLKYLIFLNKQIREITHMTETTRCTAFILDDHYKKCDLLKVTSESKQLSEEYHLMLYDV